MKRAITAKLPTVCCQKSKSDSGLRISVKTEILELNIF